MYNNIEKYKIKFFTYNQQALKKPYSLFLCIPVRVQQMQGENFPSQEVGDPSILGLWYIGGDLNVFPLVFYLSFC